MLIRSTVNSRSNDVGGVGRAPMGIMCAIFNLNTTKRIWAIQQYVDECEKYSYIFNNIFRCTFLYKYLIFIIFSIGFWLGHLTIMTHITTTTTTTTTTKSSTVFSNEHTKLVWTLNFYLIETTSKFVPDCNLLSNTIISANNILKRTINLEQYLCILHVS